MVTSKASRKLTHWQPKFLEFEFYFLDSAGIGYQGAEAFLRLPSSDTYQTRVDKSVPVLLLTGEMIRKQRKHSALDGDKCVIDEQTVDKSIPFLRKSFTIAEQTKKSENNIQD